MESTRHPPARRPTEPAPPATDADRYKEGEPAVPPPEGGAARAGETAAQRREREEKERHEREQRDVKPDDHGRAGYQTRT